VLAEDVDAQDGLIAQRPHLRPRELGAIWDVRPDARICPSVTRRSPERSIRSTTNSNSPAVSLIWPAHSIMPSMPW